MAGSKQDDVIPHGFTLTDEQLEAIHKKWDEAAEQTQAIEEAEPLDIKMLEQAQPSLKKELLLERLNELLSQRNDQRDKIFRLAKWYCWVSLIFLIAIVAIQIAGRIAGPNLDFKVFDGNELQTLVIGVFGQFVGLLYIITKSLYNDANYKELFKDMLNNE